MAKQVHIELAPAMLLSLEEQNLVRRELETLIASAPFRNSQQCQNFLKYVVSHTLSGDDGSLRERVIGNAVFGRQADYDTGDDPVVRIRAAEVRKRLAQYYQSLDQPPAVTIQIPSGSYRVAFLWEQDEAKTLEEGVTVSAVSTGLQETLPLKRIEEPLSVPVVRHEDKRRFLGWVIAAAALLCLITFSVRYYQSRHDRLLQAFWQPFIDSPKPVILSIGSNAVYRISDEVADRYGVEHHLEGSGMEFFPDFPPDTTLHAAGIHATPDSFVALGDVAAVSETVANLTKMHKPYQERFSNDISFAELRNNPTVLIGGFNNPMTRELTRNFRFVFAARNRIEDRQTPGKAWILKASEDSHDTEDYAIISRVLQQNASAPLLSVAGLGQYGTVAATDFVFDPSMLEAMEHEHGEEWRNKNLQILLRIKVRDFKPESVTVLATHTW